MEGPTQQGWAPLFGRHCCVELPFGYAGVGAGVVFLWLFADLRDRLETKMANTPTTAILELGHNKNQEDGGWPHAIAWPSSTAGKAIA